MMTAAGVPRILVKDGPELTLTTGFPRPSSTDCVRSAMAGDRTALRAIWEQHRRWVAAILLAYKPAGAELEDLVQEVALTLVSRIAELRDADQLRPWLRSVAINIARAAGRRAAVRSRPYPSSPRVAPADETVLRWDEVARVQSLLVALPENFREPLLLQSVQGLRMAEIAQTLGLPETTVQTRIARARRMLRELAAPAFSSRGLCPGASEKPLHTLSSREKP